MKNLKIKVIKKIRLERIKRAAKIMVNMKKMNLKTQKVKNQAKKRLLKNKLKESKITLKNTIKLKMMIRFSVGTKFTNPMCQLNSFTWILLSLILRKKLRFPMKVRTFPIS